MMAKSLRQTTMKVKIDVDSKALEGADKKLDDTSKSAESLEKASKKTGTAVKNTGQSLKDTAKSADESSSSLKRHTQSSTDAAKGADKLTDSSKKLKEVIATIGAAAIAKEMYELGKAAIQVGMDFDKGMSTVKAVAGASASEFESMRKQAIQLGADTTKSAKEVSVGQLELTKSGMSAKQAMEAIPGAISASTASGEEMSVAVSVMTSALNGFQLKASESAHVADVLAEAANRSKADINDMGYAFKYAATPAKALGMSLEETSSAVMVMTNAGLAGEQAGTSLRSALISLTDPSEDATKQIEKLGVKITDSKGNMEPFAEIMNGLRKNTEGMGNAQKMAALSTIFGTEAATGMLNIIDSAPGTMEKFTKSLKDSDGASKKASDTITDNLAGSVEGLKGSIESASIIVSDVLTPTVRKGTDALSDLVGGFNDLSPSAKSVVVWGTVIVGGIIPASVALYKVHKAVKSVREVMGGAKTFFSSYRSEMQKTGAQALITASEVQTMNRAINTNTVTGGTTVTGGNSTAKKSVILDQYGVPLQSSSTPKVTPKMATTATKSTPAIASSAKSLVTSKLPNTISAGSNLAKGSSALATVGKVGKFAKFGKAVPYIGTALSALSLIGTTKENVGENVGGFGGSLAGGASGAMAGAALGSIVPGIGTAIGGAVGGIAGSLAGTKFGSEFGKTVQKHWPEITKTVDGFTEKHPLLTKAAVASNPILSIIHGVKSAKAKYDDAFKDTLTSNVKFGKGVSKSTSSSVKEYEKLNSKATEQLNLLQWSGEKISEETAKSLKANYSDMADSIQNSMKTKFGKSENTLSTFLKESGFSETEQSAITKSVEDNHKEQKDTVEKYQKEINKIIDKASKEKRSITKEEQNEINKYQEKMNNSAIKTLSKSAKEQETIMTMLKAESSRISAKQAADVVKSSKKARDGAVKDANKKYKDVVAAANQEFLENKSITEEQRDAIVKKAKETRDGSVKQAEDMNSKVVEQAQLQASGHLKQVDWETGQVLSKWDQLKVSLAGRVNAVTGGVNKILEFFNIPGIPEWIPAGYTSAKNPLPKNLSVSQVSASAIGNNSHPGGKGLVGEEGVELAYKPFSGKATLLGTNGPEIANIEPGTRILNHRDTKSVLRGGLGKSAVLPGYDNGNSKIGDFVKSAKDKTSAITDDILSFITDPSSAIKKLIAKNPLSNDIGGIGAGALEKIKDGAVGFLKDKTGDFASIGSVGGAGAESAKKWILQAMAITSTPSSYLNGLMTIAKKESGFNPKAINLWDSNAKAGHPSQGLFQTIPSTFAAHRNKSLPNDITNPVANAVSAINYMNSRYGGIGNVPGLKNMASGKGYVGYAKGGRVNQNGEVLVGENGPELVDLPFGSYVNNNMKTNELLKNSGSPQISFAPVIHIKIDGGSNNTSESVIQRAVNAALEKAFKDFRSIIDSGVAY